MNKKRKMMIGAAVAVVVGILIGIGVWDLVANPSNQSYPYTPSGFSLELKEKQDHNYTFAISDVSYGNPSTGYWDSVENVSWGFGIFNTSNINSTGGVIIREGTLIESLNNSTNIVVFYDNDNNSRLSVGDVFLLKMDELNIETYEGLRFRLIGQYTEKHASVLSEYVFQGEE